MRIRIHNTEPHNLPHLFSMRSSALKTSKLLRDLILNGLSPVFHEIERVEDVKAALGYLLLNGLPPVFHEIERVEDVKAVGPGQHWLDLLLNGLLTISMRSSTLKTSKLSGGPPIKWPLTCFP